MAATYNNFGYCKLERYEPDECKSNPWQMPSYSSDDLDASFYPAYSYSSSSCNTSFSSDFGMMGRQNSSFSSSRRSSNVSPITSMSGDDCYTPNSDHDSTYGPNQIPITFCLSGGSAGPGQYVDQHLFTSPIGQQPCVTRPTACWEDPNVQTYLTSSLPEQMIVQSTSAGVHLQPADPPGPNGVVDPPLTRPMMFHDTFVAAEVLTEPVFSQRADNIGFAAPKTITPRAAFHPMLSSPNESMICPVTPIKNFGVSSFDLMSSPMGEETPTSSSSRGLAIRANWDHDAKVGWTADFDTYPKRPRSPSPEIEEHLKRRANWRMTGRQARKKAAPKSTVVERGQEDEALIPNNEFFCSFPNCCQSNTKRTSFRRQEHLKRHEKTVHGNEKPFRCRFCDRGFNRNDNLKQHYKTHAKNAPSSRNHWVAVLDKSSVYYDPDFEGAITRDGYPIRDGLEVIGCCDEDCVDVFHTEEALRAHEMKKEHRQDGAGKLVAVGMKGKSVNGRPK